MSTVELEAGPTATTENEGYIADGHMLWVRIADGYIESHLSCPGATCHGRPENGGACMVKAMHDDVGLEFFEWQHHPYREAALPCLIEWRWEGSADEAELFWRPVVNDAA